LNRRTGARLIVTLAFAATLTAASLPRSVSTSRQFIVYGADQVTRGAVCDLAERTKRNFLALLQLRDDWKTPIVVHAGLRAPTRPDAPVAQSKLSQTGFGLKLQVDVTLGAGSDTAAIEQELLRALLVEFTYRNAAETPPDTAYAPPPDWLVYGALALAPDREITLAAETPAMSLADFLRQRPEQLDSPSRTIYRAQAAALVAMLIQMPGGRDHLAAMLRDLPHSSGDSLADLRAPFPQLGATDAECAEQWRHAFAALGSRERSRMLSCEATERALAALLNAAVPAPTGSNASAYTLDDFATFARSPAAAPALKHLNEELLLLSGRANPLYASIIAEYRQVTLLLMRQKTKRIAERLARLRSDREEINRRMGAIGDYLNWFEATQTRTPSGGFAEYMKTAEAAAERESRRRDPISVYLDALEAQLND
jgi:hypothetical protein